MRVMNTKLPIAIIGAGPIGLAAAAHAVSRGERVTVIEAGTTVGANIREWEHVRLFSGWEYNMDKTAERLLEKTDWVKPAGDIHPTGEDLYRQYLLPLSQTDELRDSIMLETKLIAAGRSGVDKVGDDREERPFMLHIKTKSGRKTILAKAVIDSTGTWNQPNPIGSGGIEAPGEEEASFFIQKNIPDILGRERRRYIDKKTAVIGNGHSAIHAVLALAELKKEHSATEIHWFIRGSAPRYGGGKADALPERGALGLEVKALVENGDICLHTNFRTEEVDCSENTVSLAAEDGRVFGEFQNVVANTGARPDFSITRELRTSTDAKLESVPALAPLIDPNIHSCGTVRPHGEKELRQPERNFYIVGAKSYGRAPTFLLAVGYEQVRSVIAYLTGDKEGAEKTGLHLPETGVCSSSSLQIPLQTSCC